MFATLPRDRAEILPALLRAQLNHVARTEPALLSPDVGIERLAGRPANALRFVQPRIACCGECGARPGDPEARTCNVANCGLIGRHHHAQGDRT